MASPGGTSSGSSTALPNSGSEEELQVVIMDQRKRKRMLSNRESARRSRMRKQKHLDDLMAQVAQLRKENNQILTTYKVTAQQCLAVEAENSVLRTQMVELGNRLQSLNEIASYMSVVSNGYAAYDASPAVMDGGFLMNSHWNNLLPLNQPLMASDMPLC